MAETPLPEIYRTHRTADVAALGGEPADDDTALPLLTRLCEVGEAAWDGVAVARATFVRYLAARAARTGSLGQLSAEAVAELYLCCACADGDAGALDAFDRRYLRPIAGQIAHMKLGPATTDEVIQLVRHKLLLTRADGRAKVDEYAGQAKLPGLVQVVATRTALDLLRQHKREPAAQTGDLARLQSPEHDPELQYLKAHYRAAFRDAFAAAVGELGSRERNLLRMHLLRGVTLEQLAEMYGVHRATAVRWLAKAREQLFAETRRIMRRELHVDTDEFDSVMGLIQSRFDVSVERLLQTVEE